MTKKRKENFEEIDEDAEESTKESKNKKDSKFKAHEVFGISEARSKELYREFRHAEIDTDKFTDLAMSLDINNSGELGYKIFLWASRVSKNDTDMEGFIIGRIRR